LITALPIGDMFFINIGAITAILSSPQIPMELGEWNMDVLETLSKYREIERDNFDFKSRGVLNKGPDRLEIHVCAMTNTITGILALGVNDPSEDNPTATFTKDGFREETEIQTLDSIRNLVMKVDPLPKVTHKVLSDETDHCLYIILKVEGFESQRPYMIKDTSKIFVRIGDSTTPASRTTIANLFVNLLERRNSIRRLQVHCSLLRNELILTAGVIDTVKDNTYLGIIPLLDLQSFKEAVLSAEWYLSEQNLLGQVDSITGAVVGGLYSNTHELNILNTTIEAFNKEQMNRGSRYTIFGPTLDKWKPHRIEFKYIIGSLEDIIAKCTNYLQSS
jgi:schlafen family protein